MKKLWIALVAVLIVAGVSVTWSLSAIHRPNELSTINQSRQNTPTSREIQYIAKRGITSLAQLKATVADVQTKQSKYGEYVAAIGDHAGGTDGNYWSFYIDGKLASVGADAYTQKGGEHIVWKYQRL